MPPVSDRVCSRVIPSPLFRVCASCATWPAATRDEVPEIMDRGLELTWIASGVVNSNWMKDSGSDCTGVLKISNPFPFEAIDLARRNERLDRETVSQAAFNAIDLDDPRQVLESGVILEGVMISAPISTPGCCRALHLPDAGAVLVLPRDCRTQNPSGPTQGRASGHSLLVLFQRWRRCTSAYEMP